MADITADVRAACPNPWGEIKQAILESVGWGVVMVEGAFAEVFPAGHSE
jgi:hypothetical protein